MTCHAWLCAVEMASSSAHLWTPEQFRQMNTPRLTLAHVGPLAPQSEHRRLSSSFISAVRIRLCSSFCALLTLFLLLPDMMAGYGAPAAALGRVSERTALNQGWMLINRWPPRPQVRTRAVVDPDHCTLPMASSIPHTLNPKICATPLTPFPL